MLALGSPSDIDSEIFGQIIVQFIVGYPDLMHYLVEVVCIFLIGAPTLNRNIKPKLGLQSSLYMLDNARRRREEVEDPFLDVVTIALFNVPVRQELTNQIGDVLIEFFGLTLPV